MNRIQIQHGGRAHRLLAPVLLVALISLAAIVPFVYPPFLVQQLALVLVYAVAILGLNLLVGFSGQISLAHSAFFAVGAYTGAVLVHDHHWPNLAPLPVAALITYGMGLLLGLPALRLRGLYLAMVTFGIALAVPPVLIRFASLTGGNQGVVVDATALTGLGLAQDQWSYLVSLGVAVVAFVLCRNLVGGRLGRGLVTIRDKEFAAAALGVNASRLKSLAFAWSAAYAGVAGCLFTYVTGYVAPDSFTFILGVTLLVSSVVGGVDSIFGAVLGALFMQFVPELGNTFNPGLVGIFYAVALVVVVLLAPRGLAGLVTRLLGLFIEVVHPAAPSKEHLVRSTDKPVLITDSGSDSRSLRDVGP